MRLTLLSFGVVGGAALLVWIGITLGRRWVERMDRQMDEDLRMTSERDRRQSSP